jgi:hypothetical protein
LKELDAMETLKSGLEVEAGNEILVQLMSEIKEEYELDNNLAIDHPERHRFEVMLKWLA